MTPMMEQYLSVKEQYRDYLLFYRLGDFYEMFFDDAIKASRAIGLTLTGRDCGEAERAPMCGVPYHAVDDYIGQLIEKGFKIAICEQMEDPALAKGIVKREVVRVVTPGTLIEPGLLTDQKNNYLCSVCMSETAFGVCFADVSTGQVLATSLSGEDPEARLLNEIAAYVPSEVIVNLPISSFAQTADKIVSRTGAMIADKQAGRFEEVPAAALVRKQFAETIREEAFADREMIRALGAILSYIADMQKRDISYIKELHIYHDGQYMELDINTRRNLELTETLRAKEKRGSLLWVLDKTRTAPGARLLRQWVEHPLLNIARITKRQGAVEELHGQFLLREQLGELLSHVLDMERLITRIVYGTANGRDLRAIAAGASVLPEMRELLRDCKSSELSRIRDDMDLLEDLRELIERSIRENPSALVREGNMIADGFNEELDRLRSLHDNSKEWVKKLEESEREKTGIKTLRISSNNVFGYYIEVTKSLTAQVPDRYIRKQTLANCERYVTPELKELEQTVFGSGDKIKSLEYELFGKIRGEVAENSARVQRTASLLAQLDVYVSLATVAARENYVCPTVDKSDVVDIRDGRHPVVEQFVRDNYFVPNDTLLDTKKNRIMLITGPNMAGKSTYMRQTALIVLLAQIGSFVPAAEAHIGIVDKIFTRVGASDDLASGQSTFMLEMNEVAYILKNATAKSLIIYDEVGRGTSTYDGMSIARAIVEYTNSRKIGAKTLFATHYHELTAMENDYDGIVNYNIAAKKRGDNITFLRKIVRGSTDDSYGIEVAKLAGLPGEVVKRAKEILAETEKAAAAARKAGLTEGAAGGTGAQKEQEEEEALSISLDDCLREQILEELKTTDLNTLSPFECMQLLFNWKKRLP